MCCLCFPMCQQCYRRLRIQQELRWFSYRKSKIGVIGFGFGPAVALGLASGLALELALGDRVSDRVMVRIRFKVRVRINLLIAAYTGGTLPIRVRVHLLIAGCTGGTLPVKHRTWCKQCVRDRRPFVEVSKTPIDEGEVIQKASGDDSVGTRTRDT